MIKELVFFSKNKNYWLILALSFILYGNSIMNKYALDDAIVVSENMYTKQGFAGIKKLLTTDTFRGFFKKKKNLVAGGRYRPLSLVTLAIEYEFFGLNPHVSHFFNILLYGLSAILLYIVLLQLFEYKEGEIWKYLPLLTTLLWLFHPLHTEAVANIKGRDEILKLLGSLGAMYYLLHYMKYHRKLDLLWSAIILFLALMAKETAITFLAIIPIAVYLFYPKEKQKSMGIILLPMLLAIGIYLYIRFQVIGLPSSKLPTELMNNPFLGMTTGQKFATIVFTFGVYLKLLFVPYPLTYDYYPYHIAVHTWSEPIIWLIVLIHLGLLFLFVLDIKRTRIFALGIFIYVASFSVVSNLLFPVGTFMNERFMYIPSIGFTLIIGYLLLRYLSNKQMIFRSVLWIVILLFSIDTIARNRDWYDDFTLFTHDVNISYDSTKSNASAGGKLIEKATVKGFDKAERKKMLTQALFYLHRSVKIDSEYTDALLLMGNVQYYLNKDIDSSWYYYRKILLMNRHYERVYTNLNIMLTDKVPIDTRIRVWRGALQFDSLRYEPNYELGNLYGRYKNNMDSAFYFLLRAQRIKPDDKHVHKDLGVAYGMNGDLKNALIQMQWAYKLDPNDLQNLKNLFVTAQKLNDTKLMEFCRKKIAEREKK